MPVALKGSPVSRKDNNSRREDFSISQSPPLEAPRVKRPSISLEDIFSPAHLRTRLKWLLLLSIPVVVSAGIPSLPLVSLAFAGVAGVVTYEAIPDFGRLLAHAGRTGRDLNKPSQPILPESLGIAVGTIYLLALFLFIPVPFAPWLLHAQDPQFLSAPLQFPFEQLGAYTAALLSITCMLLLGFADDVLNLKWRHKILIPALSTLPLLMIYAVTSGRTAIAVPLPLRPLLGRALLDLGPLYYAYMAMLAIFCTHSINILAGVNGVEVGQSVIIAASVILHNALSLAQGEASAEHLFSLTLMLPFLAVSLGLLRRNWWPASVFVGDTYCYFAGMTFAVVGILGHFGKTLLLLFLPQLFNFIYSMPQLFGWVPCPRHRLPRLDPKTGLLQPSTVTFALTPVNRPLVRLLLALQLLHTFEVGEGEQGDGNGDGGGGGRVGAGNSSKDGKGRERARPEDGTDSGPPHTPSLITTNNLTILNLLLVRAGPLREDRLAILLMAVQGTCTLLALLIRHHLASYMFP